MTKKILTLFDAARYMVDLINHAHDQQGFCPECGNERCVKRCKMNRCRQIVEECEKAEKEPPC